MRVLRAKARDALHLAPMFNDYRAFYGLPQSPDAVRFLRKRMERNESVVFLARIGGRVAGFAQLYPTFDSLDLRRRFILHDLFVDPAARRLGVARALLDRAKAHARSRGARTLALETAIRNRPAQQLYRSAGWEPETTFRTFTLTLEPAPAPGGRRGWTRGHRTRRTRT